MEKLFYGLTPEDKAAVAEHFVTTKYSGTLTDYILEYLKNQVIDMKKTLDAKKWQSPTGVAIDLDVEELQKTTIVRDTNFKQPGEKGVLVLYPKMFEGLCDWYKLQNYLAKLLGAPKKITSLEMFVQQFAQELTNDIKYKVYAAELDQEIQESKKQAN